MASMPLAESAGGVELLVMIGAQLSSQGTGGKMIQCDL